MRLFHLAGIRNASALRGSGGMVYDFLLPRARYVELVSPRSVCNAGVSPDALPRDAATRATVVNARAMFGTYVHTPAGRFTRVNVD